MARNSVTHPKIQHLILLRQTCHEGILRQIILPRRILLISPFDLRIERSNMLWQQPCEFELCALFRRKAGSFVEVWRVEQGGSS